MKAETDRPEEGQRIDRQSGQDREHRRYRRFDEEFKREAVRLSELPGKTLASVARSLGIDVNTLGLWRKRYGSGAKPVGRPQGDQAADAAIDPSVVAMQHELMELRTRLRHLEMERDILKKAMSVFARDEQMTNGPISGRPANDRASDRQRDDRQRDDRRTTDPLSDRLYKR